MGFNWEKMDAGFQTVENFEVSAPLLFVIGVDGVGKTTIARWIVSLFERKNIHADLVWSRFNNYLSLPLLALTRVTGHNYYMVRKGITFGFHDFERLFFLRRLFFFFQLIDVNIATYFKLSRRIKKKSVLICERGPWDTLVDVISDTGLYNSIGSFAASLYACQVLYRAKVIYLKGSYDNIILRRPELVHDKKLELRMSLYEYLAERNKWFVIDNNGTLSSTKNKIKTILQYHQSKK